MAPPVWLLTTRGRGAAARAVWLACRAAGMRSELVVYVDGDHEGYDWLRGSGLRYHVDLEGAGLAASMQWCLWEYPEASSYGWLADDTYPRTPGFDVELERAAGRFGLAYAYDGWLADTRPNEVRSGHILTSGLVWGGELVRAVGAWAIPHGVKQAAIDHVWCRVIAFLLLQHYLPHVTVEHHNWRTGKRSYDSTDEWVRDGDAYVLRDIRLADEFLASIEFRHLIVRVRRRLAEVGYAGPQLGDVLEQVTEWQEAHGAPVARSRCCLARIPTEEATRCPECGQPLPRYSAGNLPPAMPATVR